MNPFSPNSKNTKPKLRTQLIASGLSLLMCASALTGTTYAWFSESQHSATNTLSGAWYHLTVSDSKSNEDVKSVVLGLSQEDLHYFTLTAEGTASTGYCTATIRNELTGNSQSYCINPIPQGSTIQVVIQAAAKTTVEFSTSWGAPADNTESVMPTSGFGRESAPFVFLEFSATPSIEYPVPEGATLSSLAHYYGVSEQEILTYNGLETLNAGETIRIPYVDEASAPKPYAPPKVEVHVVAEGDTLQLIAEAYGVPVSSLCQWNGIHLDTLLGVGMELEIPIIAVLPGQEPTEPEATEPEPTEPEPTEPEPTEPEPTEPEPTEPEPTEPEPTEPEPTEPEPTEPEPTEPEPTEPELTEPEPTEPEPTEPEPTEPKPTEPEPTEPEPTEPEPTEPKPTEPEPTEPEKPLPSYLVNNVPLYYQTDYPDVLYGSGTVATSGCSITCLAMVSSAMTGHDYQPDELAEYFGGRAENNLARLEMGSDALHLSWEKSENWHETLQALVDGKIVIALMEGDSIFTDTQHFIVLTGLNEEGRIMVNDPAAYNYEEWILKNGFDNGFTENDILLGYSGGWIYDPEAMPEKGVERYSQPRVDKKSSRYNIQLTAEERELLARMIWVEARGEILEGQQAVAEVVFNRMTSDRFSNTLKGVIYAEGQFESVPLLDTATPYQAQYQAIDRALYGEYVLPMDVFYFSTSKKTEDVWGMIDHHIFSR